MTGMTFAFAATGLRADGTKLIDIKSETYTLKNGLRVVLSVDRSAPVVATFVHYHVGSKNERSDRTGFAHFFEHLMFEGSENIPRHSIDKLIQGAGGNLNAFTTFDETGYQIQVPKNELKLALWIESERMLHAVINEEGVETQRSVVKEERKSRLDNRPFGSILENMAKYAGDGTPYSWTPIGSAQYIDQATIEEFRDFYKTYYVPNNAVLAIVGDFDVAETKKLIESYFGDIPRGKDVVRPEVNLKIGRGEIIKDVVEDATPIPALVYVYPTPERNNPDAYAIELMTNILATGESSRLYRKLVDDEQVALQTSSFPIQLEKGGIVAALAIGRDPSSDLDELSEELDDVIDDLIENGVSDRELQKAKNQIETDYAGGFNSVLSKAQALASAVTFYGDANRVNTDLDNYLRVTKEDIKRVAAKYLSKENRIVLRYLMPGTEQQGDL